MAPRLITSVAAGAGSRAAATVALSLTLACGVPAAARAQARPIDGYVSITADHLPNAADTTEVRARLFVAGTWRTTRRVTLELSGFAEGLLADRSGRVATGRLRPHEAYVDVSAGAFDLRVGLGNVVWGRLDEIQPTDVVNPIDVSRYLVEGRAEARLPVPMTRVRWFAGEKAAIEALWVPFFRRGRFDLLDEGTSPFNLSRDGLPLDGGQPIPGCETGTLCVPILVERDQPPRTLASSQGGVRLSATSGRVDWALAAFSGLQSFGRYDVPISLPAPGAALVVTERYPRFTMLGGDAETVRGDWAVRGEVALVVDDTIFVSGRLRGTEGRSVQAGGGADRRAGDYRLSGTLLVQHRRADGFSDTNVSIVAGGERSFARETRRVRLFAVWNMSDASGFARSIGTWSLRDDLALEASLGWFFGDGDDTLSRFSARDFVTVRLKAGF